MGFAARNLISLIYTILRTQLALTTFYLWTFSSVAFLSNLLAPELPLIQNSKTSAEYPIIKKIQDVSLELQLLELSIKNRRNQEFEKSMNNSLEAIDKGTKELNSNIAQIKETQSLKIGDLITVAKRFGNALNIPSKEWATLEADFKSTSIKSGTITIKGISARNPRKLIEFDFLNLSALYSGKALVWKVSLPESSRSYWKQTKHYWNQADISIRLTDINRHHLQASKIIEGFYRQCHLSLYQAFDDHRFGILARVQMIRQSLIQLSQMSGAMNSPEELSSLYNSLIENLYSFGVNLSLSSEVRDFKIKGFIFGDSPESAQDLFKKLKFFPSQNGVYNSSSS